MESSSMMGISIATVMLVLQLLSNCCIQTAEAQTAIGLKNCSFPAVYGFGDSLSDTGNAIAAFPHQFANAELAPNGYWFPMHPADRYCDGKLILDFMTFGVRRRPVYASLRQIAPDLQYGVNFAASGASARTTTTWTKGAGFNTPFSLDIQLQWLQRYKVRLHLYELQKPVVVVQDLPKEATLNASLYIVYAGYQDYFFSLYDSVLTPAQTLEIVGSVVQGIVTFVEGVVTFGALDIMVLNLPPLGCIPAMLTQFQSSNASYDSYGCLTELNAITTAHNLNLSSSIVSLRAQYPSVKIHLADINGVYTDMLKDPLTYNVTEPLKACCGVGGSYNFNKQVQCTAVGAVGNEVVNLTAVPCTDSALHLSWDGIHTSNTFNRAAATAFLSGTHISPSFNCSPDFTYWESRV